jgi:hypothetical protein
MNAKGVNPSNSLVKTGGNLVTKTARKIARIITPHKVVQVIPVANEQPRTFQIPSSLEGGAFLTREDANLIGQKISEVVQTALENGTFLNDLNFEKQLSFSAYWVYTASLKGWIIDPERFLLAMSWIVVDDKMLDIGDPHFGNYYFDAKNNRFEKIVDPEDLKLLKNYHQFHTDMRLCVRKLKDGEIHLSWNYPID